MVRPKPRWMSVLLTAAVVLAGMASVNGQGAGASVDGTVTDQQGGALPGATITLQNQESGVARTVTTENNGRYRFPALSPGRYSLKAELSGFAGVEIQDIVLTIGLEVRRDITLNVESIAEALTVTAEVPVVDVTRSEVAGVVTQQQMAALPINSREYLKLALLMPGTSSDGVRSFYSSVNVGTGTTFYSTQFLVDNMTNKNVEQGEPKQNFPQDSVREFKVNTMQFKAEYGLATGGLVSIVTKAGSNSFQGNGFEYFRDRALNAKRFFEQAKPDFRRHQFGASVGGPITKDKVHFFAALERTQLSEFFTVNTGRPELYSAVEGTFERPGHTNLYTFRTDAQLTGTQSVFVRYAHEDEKRTCFDCGGTSARNAGYDQTIPRRAVVAGHTWILSKYLLNDFRFQYAISTYEIAPAGTTIFRKVGDYPSERVGPQRIQRRFVFPSLTYGGNFDEIGPEARIQLKEEFSVHIPNSRGPHDLKFGIDYSRIPFKDDNPGNLGGSWTFGTDQFFNPNDPASIAALRNPISFTQQAFPINDDVPTTQFSWFVQDDWKPLANLTLNLGLRYDRQFGSFNEDLDPDAFPRRIPFMDPASRGDSNNFGPRTGFAYDLRNNGQTVIRGGYGLYYDSIRTLPNFGERRNLRALTIVIPNPSYPDPFGGQDPISFISTAAPNVSVLHNEFHNPFAHQYNLGFAQQLTSDFALNIDGVFAQTRDDRKIRDLNARDPLTGIRPDPTFARIDSTSSDSKTDYRAMFVRLDKRFSHRNQFLVSYTLGKVEDDNPGQRVNDLAREDLDFGPANIDRRHTIAASGSVLLPYDVTFGAVWVYRSSRPFSARAGRDLNNDLFTNDYIPGTSRNQMNRGADLEVVNVYRVAQGQPALSENDIDDSSFSSFDIRANKQFAVGGNKRLELIAQVFNVFNRVNLIPGYIENARSASFGRILTAGDGTQAELGVRFVW